MKVGDVMMRNLLVTEASTPLQTAAERMCDFIFMIYQGKKVLDGTLETIQDAFGEDILRVRVDGDKVDLNGLPGVTRIRAR